MAPRRRIRLPEQWSRHVKSGILQTISLASVVLAHARGRVTGRRRLQARLEQAETEIAMLQEELRIKDGRWERSRSRRRPHYTPTQRMRILQLRAARGWNLEQTAKVFLIDLHTLQLWMRRIDEQGERALIQLVEPVNRYPDVVRHVVRQLRCVFPSMGCERLAAMLARIGLHLGATTIRRIEREDPGPPEPEAEVVITRRRRRVVAKYPGHTWHLDLTTVPIRSGFWVSWIPFSLPQCWPFCWWVAVVVDQMSRAMVGFAVFGNKPGADQMRRFLDRAIRRQRFAPKHIVTDKDSIFRSDLYRCWCKRRGIRRRFGALGEPASIPIVERFILSMKHECTRWLLVPLTLAAMRRELGLYATWYNEHRPHTTLEGRTPAEVLSGRVARAKRIEPRPRWPHRLRRSNDRGDRFRLVIEYVGGRKHLPVIELRRAA